MVRAPVEAFYDAARALTERLLAGMALALGLDEHAFTPFHRVPIATMRLLHYPPRPAEPIKGQLGAGAHTDWGAVTVLAQDDAGGLQVLDRDATTWVDVPPVPGAFVVNIGDLMARWTNDRYRSTVHRVVPPEDATASGGVLHGPRPPRHHRGPADLRPGRRATPVRSDDGRRAPAREVPRLDARVRRRLIRRRPCRGGLPVPAG